MEGSSVIRRYWCSCSTSINQFSCLSFSNKIKRRSSSNNVVVRTNNYASSSSSSLISVCNRKNSCAMAAEASAVVIVEEEEEDETRKREHGMPILDKSGRFCSPRAARELALTILYAACLQGSDPIRLFDKRLNAPKEAGYEFKRDALLEYDHMSFAGPPLVAQTLHQESQLLLNIDQQSATEAEILSAPPKLVYSKLVLRFTRKLLVAVLDNWDSHVIAINRVVPQKWQTQPASKILELSILHLAMAEISVVGTRHPIVINEAVDLAKRFCDGAAPRIINGCLRTFVKDSTETTETALSQVLNANQKVPAEV